MRDHIYRLRYLMVVKHDLFGLSPAGLIDGPDTSFGRWPDQPAGDDQLLLQHLFVSIAIKPLNDRDG